MLCLKYNAPKYSGARKCIKCLPACRNHVLTPRKTVDFEFTIRVQRRWCTTRDVGFHRQHADENKTNAFRWRCLEGTKKDGSTFGPVTRCFSRPGASTIPNQKREVSLTKHGSFSQFRTTHSFQGFCYGGPYLQWISKLRTSHTPAFPCKI